jgi:hypothetical protein
MGPAYDVLRKSLGDDTWNAWTKLVTPRAPEPRAPNTPPRTGSTMLIAGILLSICVTIVLGVPIAGALAIVAIAVTMWITAGPDLLVIFIQRAYAATTSFPLLAIPFFILAGNLMNVGGTTERIFAVAKLCSSAACAAGWRT